MPLKHGSSKKSFKSNVETEMSEGKPLKQSLAIAYNVKRGNKRKKMAEGGIAKDSAKLEPRPMPSETAKDSKEVSHNSGDKPPMMDSATSRPDIKQSQKGPKTTAIKHPRMVKSDILQVRLRDEEDHLQDSAGVNNGPQEQPPEHDNEEGADRQGPSVPALKMKRMASGGMINDSVPMNKAEEDEVEHPARLEEDNDEMRPNESEYMANHFASGGSVESGSPDMNYAEGGMAEQDMDHEDSIAAAIMAKKDRKKLAMSDSDMDEMVRLYDGGEVNGADSIYSDDSDQADLSRNAEEDANMEDQSSFDALRKENYNEFEGLAQLDSPKDSNRHGHLLDSDDHDMIDHIRSKMMAKRQFKQR